jgi:hypothetical protein
MDALRRHSNLMPITVPNYNRKTDRLRFGTLIGINRNPQGPPFQTDDPVPVRLHHYEFYIFAPEIPDSEGGKNSEEPRQASVPDLLVTKAKRTGATVTFIEDGALLESIGGAGAFLRWRE